MTVTGSMVPAAGKRRRTTTRLRAGKVPYLLTVPAVVVLVLVAGWPLLKIVLLSLQKQESSKYALFHNGGTTSWAGLQNYTDALTSSTFWTVLWRTLVFTAVNVALSLLLGIGLALLLNRVS
ncbi:MAG TPA: hypothetical protein VFU35_02270, partial [Jatrophihabitans sp.]|nr:hypothetical protein [Jatrophihabitans sp.]